MTQLSSDSAELSPECCEAEQQRNLEKVYRYMDGELTAEQVAELRRHLGDCENCRREFSVEQILREVLKRSCQEQAPSGLLDKIQIRLASGNN